MERWRAEPPDKQRAPGRVLFDREVFEGASPIRSHLFAAPSPAATPANYFRALVRAVTRAMPEHPEPNDRVHRIRRAEDPDIEDGDAPTESMRPERPARRVRCNELLGQSGPPPRRLLTTRIDCLADARGLPRPAALAAAESDTKTTALHAPRPE
jgi:hypothetical protein